MNRKVPPVFIFESVCRDIQFRESTLCDVTKGTNSPPNSLFAENAIVWIFFFVIAP